MVVGITNLPNQYHKIISRKTINYTILLCGSSGLGKTTLINTLFNCHLKDSNSISISEKTTAINVMRAELEEKGYKIKLTIVDTPGFGDFINNSACWENVAKFIDEQYSLYLEHELETDRDVLRFDDSRIHACLYFIPPTGHSLSGLDVQAMKELGSRVNLIPVIAKADTMTLTEMQSYKSKIRQSFEAHEIKIYSPLSDEEDEELARLQKNIFDFMPLSVIASEETVQLNGKLVRGREYSWGIAEVENEDHCDFIKLRNLLIRTNMHDLISTTREEFYENYRIKALLSRGHSDEDPHSLAKKMLNDKMKDDEENLRKRFTEQVKMEENRFRQWEQRLIAERDRLNKDLEDHHKLVKSLEEEYEQKKSVKAGF